MQELLRIPGVARKTANVVLANAFGRAEGVVVDTHVKRVAYRLGLTTQTAPEKIEQDLMAVIPQQDWVAASSLLVLLGRYICVAGRPFCSRCPVYDLCPRVGVENPR
jgi:endonuclease-3